MAASLAGSDLTVAVAGGRLFRIDRKVTGQAYAEPERLADAVRVSLGQLLGRVPAPPREWRNKKWLLLRQFERWSLSPGFVRARSRRVEPFHRIVSNGNFICNFGSKTFRWQVLSRL